MPEQLAANRLHVLAAAVGGGLISGGLREVGLCIDLIRHAADARTRGIGDCPLVSVAGLRRNAHRRQDVARDRHVGSQIDVVAVVGADGHAAIDRRFLSRRVGDDIDRAADGVASEERALRTLQDFNAIHIQQALVCTDGARQIHAVEVDTDARVQIEGEVVLADAANRRGQYRTVAGKRRAAVQVHVRRQVRQRMYIGQAFAAQCFGGKSRDGDRDVLDILGALLGGNDDFFQLLVREGR